MHRSRTFIFSSVCSSVLHRMCVMQFKPYFSPNSPAYCAAQLPPGHFASHCPSGTHTSQAQATSGPRLGLEGSGVPRRELWRGRTHATQRQRRHGGDSNAGRLSLGQPVVTATRPASGIPGEAEPRGGTSRPGLRMCCAGASRSGRVRGPGLAGRQTLCCSPQ